MIFSGDKFSSDCRSGMAYTLLSSKIAALVDDLLWTKFFNLPCVAEPVARPDWKLANFETDLSSYWYSCRCKEVRTLEKVCYFGCRSTFLLVIYLRESAKCFFKQFLSFRTVIGRSLVVLPRRKLESDPWRKSCPLERERLAFFTLIFTRLLLRWR